MDKTKQAQANESSQVTETVLDKVIIRSSPIHGTGIFARVDLPADEELLEYVGERIDKETSARLCGIKNAYIFHMNEEHDIDGSVEWNPARFFNHSCRPNCEAQQDDEDRIWIMTRRPILAGEELTYNYGYDLEDYLEFPCRCGAEGCIGYMIAEELFPQVRKALALRLEAEAEPAGAAAG